MTISTHFNISVGDAFLYSILERKSSAPDFVVPLELSISLVESDDIVLCHEMRRGGLLAGDDAWFDREIRADGMANAYERRLKMR